MKTLVKFFKKLPIDFNQYEMREKSKAKQIAFNFAKSHKQGKKLLDIGCRDGYWSEQFKNLGLGVTSIDIDPKYISGKKVNANEKLPFDDNSFDIIWSSEVIEHLLDPKASLNEMKRVLKSDGVIVLTTPNSYFWLFRFLTLFNTMEEIQNPDHKHFFAYKDIKDLDAGADIAGFWGPFMYMGPKFKLTGRLCISFLSPTFIIYAGKQ